jgi:hypothetical protein
MPNLVGDLIVELEQMQLEALMWRYIRTAFDDVTNSDNVLERLADMRKNGKTLLQMEQDMRKQRANQ